MRAPGLIVAIGVAGWLFALPALALGFVLEDGETVEGAIVAATRNTITIRRTDGGMRQLPVGRLQRVWITTDGQTIGGRFVGWRDGRTRIEIGSEVVWIEHDRVVERGAVAGRAPAPADPAEPAVAATPAAPAAAGGASAEVTAPLPARQAAPEPAAGPEQAALPARDLPVVSVRTAPGDVTEASGDIVFTVELSRPIDELLVVIYSTVDGTAEASADYAPLQGILTFSAGAVRSEIRTTIVDDREAEDDKDFNLFLAANPDLATVAQQWTQVTIHDDD